MGILDFIFGTRKKLPISKILNFNRIESEYRVELGQKLKIWNKPNSKQINLYAKGSANGEGLIGTIIDSGIGYHLANTKNLFVNTEVINLTDNKITLSVNIYASKDEVINKIQNQKKNWIESINKKYNPKTSWELRFSSESTIRKSDVKIMTIAKEQIADYYTRKEDAIWLCNQQGEIIKATNAVRTGGTEKTLRAIFSGHELEITKFKKEGIWCYMQIGIKRNAT